RDGADQTHRQCQMTPHARMLATAAAMVVAAFAGYWGGRSGVRVPLHHSTTSAAAPPSGPIIYYKDPAGRPFYSLTPKATDDGKPFLPVHANADVSVDPKAKTAPGARKVLYYRNPMGLPDVSPVPKKDAMGMDYIPVYEGEDPARTTLTLSPGRLQRTGVKTELAGKLPIVRTIRAPGVVAYDETKLSIVAMRFDGFINKVGPVTTGTHVSRGEPLMTVFGQEL